MRDVKPCDGEGGERGRGHLQPQPRAGTGRCPSAVSRGGAAVGVTPGTRGHAGTGRDPRRWLRLVAPGRKAERTGAATATPATAITTAPATATITATTTTTHRSVGLPPGTLTRCWWPRPHCPCPRPPQEQTPRGCSALLYSLGHPLSWHPAPAGTQRPLAHSGQPGGVPALARLQPGASMCQVLALKTTAQKSPAAGARAGSWDGLFPPSRAVCPGNS